jgi:cytoskeletal protein CcmA (bactofilin family)
MAEPATQMTVIGADTRIKGDMTFEGTARILGNFEGSIHAKGELQIAEGATCRAAVDAGKVTVEGVVEGNMTARERVELTAKARVKGDVVAARLVVAEGASFIGHCTVGVDAVKTARTSESDAGLPEVKPGMPGGAPREARPEAARR